MLVSSKTRIVALMLAVGVFPAGFAQHSSTTFVQTVNKATPGNGSTAPVTVSSSATPIQFGQSAVLTSTVPSSATGTITFLDGATSIGTATIASGSASFSTSSLSMGAHSISASYSGDANFNGAVSSVLSISVEKGSATVALSSSQPSSNYGTSVKFTATVTGPESPATGTVTFMDGATPLGTGTLNGSGVATLTTAALGAGSHSITAVYGGDTQLNNATSTAVAQSVAQIPVTITVTSSENPSTFGDSVTFTITVTGAGATPTGTVTVANGAATLGTVTLNGSGIATFTTSSLNAGSHTLTFTYSGDSNYE